MLKKLLKSQEVRYGISSGLSFILDTGMYWLFLTLFGTTHNAVFQILARALSSFFNFNMNKFFAYRKKDGYAGDLLRYYCVCVPQAAATVVLTSLIQNLLRALTATPLAATVSKTCVDALMFVLSFFVQKFWVFRKKQ